MNFFFKKRGQEKPKPVTFSSDLPRQGDVLPTSLKAHSQFIKRINCSQCGAPKSLPSTTAYIYCDYCGSLMDYDFRMANADTNCRADEYCFSSHHRHRAIPIDASQSAPR